MRGALLAVALVAVAEAFAPRVAPAAPARGSPVRVATEPDAGGPETLAPMKLGVLFLQLGGPSSSSREEVQGFLYNLFSDPDIIRLPPLLSGFQKPLAYLISNRRAPKSQAAYESIGGGSPIVRYTRQQARLVEERLRDAGLDARCYFGMRYWYPFTEEALDEIRRDGRDTLVVVPLYPQYSVSTSGSSLRVLQEEFFAQLETWAPPRMRHTVVPAWYHREGYSDAVARLVNDEIAGFTEAEREEGVHVLFSAHGVPKSYVDAGDPYQAQMEECVDLVARRLPEDVTVHLSYQSRVGPVEWLRPYTEETIPDLGRAGVKNLVVVPISFVSEHIETLEEIDMEYRELAEESGVEKWRRVPALNTDEVFIDDMGRLVLEALEQPCVSVTEAMSEGSASAEQADLVLLGGRAGVTSDAELVNGRAAMVGLVAVLVAELLTGSNVVHLLGLR